MTLFEYVAVAISIVLGLAAARLLDALPHILASDRRYWIHATVAGVCLANLANSWWVFWSLNALPEWTPRVHAGIAISMAVSLVIMIVGLYARAAPLAHVGN